VANSPLDRSFAQECDAADPLAGFYDRFARDDPSLIYLDGNSLGMLPLATAERISEVVRGGWGRGLIRSWSATAPRSTSTSWPAPPSTPGPAVASS
jgi:kynureninase